MLSLKSIDTNKIRSFFQFQDIAILLKQVNDDRMNMAKN